MTNKDSIQQKHLEAIDSKIECYENAADGKLFTIGNTAAATSCTTVTAEAIGEAMEWIAAHGYTVGFGGWYQAGYPIISKTKELVELFLNQKTKI